MCSCLMIVMNTYLGIITYINFRQFMSIFCWNSQLCVSFLKRRKFCLSIHWIVSQNYPKLVIPQSNRINMIIIDNKTMGMGMWHQWVSIAIPQNKIISKKVMGWGSWLLKMTKKILNRIFWTILEILRNFRLCSGPSLSRSQEKWTQLIFAKW